jgi:PAS domain S-box-containing protein
MDALADATSSATPRAHWNKQMDANNAAFEQNVSVSHGQDTGSLHWSDSLLSQLIAPLATSEDAFLVVNDAQHILMLNPRAEDLLGAPAREVLNRRVAQVLPGVYKEEIAGVFAQPAHPAAAGSTLPITRAKTVAVHSNGNHVPVEATVYPIDLESTRALVIRLRDVSERARLERAWQLQSAVAAILAQAHRPGEAILQVLQAAGEFLAARHGALWAVDDSLAILRREQAWNAQAHQAIELAATNLRLTVTRGEGLAGRVWADNRTHWLTNAAGDLSPFPTSDMERAGWQTAIAVPARSDGAVVAVMAFYCRDRHEADRDTVQLLEALGSQVANYLERKRAVQAGESRMRFLAMISHELRTPLASIKGFVTTLLANDVKWEPAAQHEFLSIVDAETDKLTELIDQVLDLARLDTGLMRIKLNVQALSDILSRAAVQLNTMTQNHRLETAIAADLPNVLADRQRVAQVLVNLVGNAVKYAPPHTGICLSAARTGDYVRVDVSDEGPGIPVDEIPHLFQPFRRGNDSRMQGIKGAGLGLAISKGLIEAHGGKIWLQEHDGPGTIISFTLPVAG